MPGTIARPRASPVPPQVRDEPDIRLRRRGGARRLRARLRGRRLLGHVCARSMERAMLPDYGGPAPVRGQNVGHRSCASAPRLCSGLAPVRLKSIYGCAVSRRIFLSHPNAEEPLVLVLRSQPPRDWPPSPLPRPRGGCFPFHAQVGSVQHRHLRTAARDARHDLSTPRPAPVDPIVPVSARHALACGERSRVTTPAPSAAAPPSPPARVGAVWPARGRSRTFSVLVLDAPAKVRRLGA